MDCCVYRLRQEPESAEARAKLFQVIEPVLRSSAKPYALTSATVVRMVTIAETMISRQLDRIILVWYLRPTHREKRLLREIKLAVEQVVLKTQPMPGSAVVLDCPKLMPLRSLNDGDVLRVLAAALFHVRQHFDTVHGRRYLALAERCVYALVISRRRPSFATAPKWGGHRYGDVAEIFSMCEQIVRAALAELLVRNL